MTLDHNAVCENCWYWETITTGYEVLGFCKRHAPIVATSPPDSGSFASFTIRMPQCLIPQRIPIDSDPSLWLR